jgi:high-affinity iron transporter
MFFSGKNTINKLLRIVPFNLMFLMCITLNFNLAALAAVDNDSIKEIKKISELINLSKGEYSESYQSNTNTFLKEEYNEANLFMGQAQKELKTLEKKLSVKNEAFIKVKDQLNLLDKTIKSKEKPDVLLKHVNDTDQSLEILAGMSLKEFPAIAPSLENGKKVFAQNCAVCHGVKGFGDGPAAASLDPKPVNFHDLEFIQDNSPYAFYRVIKNGVTGTAMPSWEYQLSQQEKWDVIKYVRSFVQDEKSLKNGEANFNKLFANNNDPDLQKMTDITFAADKSNIDLIRLLKSKDKFSAINEEDITGLVNYIRNEKTDYEAKTPVVILSKAEKLNQTVSEIKNFLYLSREKYIANNSSEAVENAIASYMAFEPIEKELGAKDTKLARKLELDFTSLKGFYSSPENKDKVDSLISEIESGLEKTASTLNTDKDGIGLFLESMFLIMREGFEAIIILMALITFIKKTADKSSKLLKNMYLGIILGILASVGTAVILDTILANSKLSKEFLEGITVLTAALILFYVSHWLISKTQAQQWQTFIKSTLGSALSNRNQWAIISVGFLSIYREGFETILFYKALYTTSTGGDMITFGFFTGCFGLAIISVLFYKFSVKIPIKEFFLVTGLLLYYMVFSFVGKGLHELQEGNLISITPVNYIPQIDLIGLYPTLETTLAQLIIVLAWFGAVAYSFLSRPKAEKLIEKPSSGAA